ncbi:MAG: hypothetical protein IT381_24465 [Deltaproteobacteria bacterium]|nr:hypothetical protein [Deltaproteobacteria bacterium]
MGDKKDDDPWQTLDSQQAQGISPEMARKLLSMNPAMRERGMTTAQLVKDSASAKPGSVKPAAKAAPEGGFETELVELKNKLDAEEKRIAEAQKQLEQARAEAKQASFHGVVKWLLSKDPDITSPLNQQVLKDEAAFLQRVGFDMKKYGEERKKKR